MTLPVGARRLFAGDLELDPDSDFVLERLLEAGDSEDLGWLVARRGEGDLATWLGRAGGRRLTRRSRAFWALVLDREPSPEVSLAQELWPL